jgi:hypothetical protein
LEMALTEVALVKMAEMLGPAGVVHLALNLRPWISYRSRWDTAHIK